MLSCKVYIYISYTDYGTLCFLPLLNFICMYFISIPWTIDLFGSLSLGFVTKATEEELHERFPSRGRACKSKAAPPSKDPKGDKKRMLGRSPMELRRIRMVLVLLWKLFPNPKRRTQRQLRRPLNLPSHPSAFVSHLLKLLQRKGRLIQLLCWTRSIVEVVRVMLWWSPNFSI